jgi:hypothetical protein
VEASLAHFVLMEYVGTAPEHCFTNALVVVLSGNYQHRISVLIDSIHWHLRML